MTHMNTMTMRNVTQFILYWMRSIVDGLINTPDNLDGYLVPLLIGAPGIGKTAITRIAAKMMDWDLLLIHLGTADGGDVQGLPFPDPENERIAYLMGDQLNSIFNPPPDRMTLCFFDDVHGADRHNGVQAGLMQFLHARELNGRKVPDNVHFILAANGREHSSGGQGMNGPLKERCLPINCVVDRMEFIEDVAEKNMWHPDIVSYLNTCDHEYISSPTIGQGEFDRTPNPRGWAHINDAYRMTMPRTPVEKGDLSDNALLSMRKKMIAAAGGDDLCHNFHCWLEEQKHVDYDIKGIVTQVYKGKGDKAELPDAEDALWVIGTLLGKSVTKDSYARFRKYVDRMPEHLIQVFESVLTTRTGNEDWKAWA